MTSFTKIFIWDRQDPDKPLFKINILARLNLTTSNACFQLWEVFWLVIINFTMSINSCRTPFNYRPDNEQFYTCIYSTLRSDKWWIWMHTMKQNSQHKEWFSTEWGKPKTKIISLANCKGHRKFNEPIKIQSKYMMQGKTYRTTD